MNEYKVVWRQVESADNLFTASCEGHIFNLGGFSMSFESRDILVPGSLPSQFASFPLPSFLR